MTAELRRGPAPAVLAATIAIRAVLPSAGVASEDRRREGRIVAAELCSACHVIGREPQGGGLVGPAFTEIAAMPSTTGVALAVFLQSHHQRMPSLHLDRDARDAVVDYILSLRDPGPGQH